MADYKVTDTELISIADAIRAKGGTSAQLEFPTEFVDAIENVHGATIFSPTILSRFSESINIAKRDNNQLNISFDSENNLVTISGTKSNSNNVSVGFNIPISMVSSFIGCVLRCTKISGSYTGGNVEAIIQLGSSPYTTYATAVLDNKASIPDIPYKNNDYFYGVQFRANSGITYNDLVLRFEVTGA